MSVTASLFVRLGLLAALVSAPVLAAEPAAPAAPARSAPAAKAPAAKASGAKAPGAKASADKPKAPGAKTSADKPKPPPGAPPFVDELITGAMAGGSCNVQEGQDAPADAKSCVPQTVSDLAISSMEEDWKPEPLPFTWDVPRVINVIPMSDVIEANGFPVKLSAVLSTERPEVILQHMVDRFEAAGLYIPPMEEQPQMLREPQLTALDPMGLISYTFILQPNPNKTTTVILGETNVGQRKPPASPVAPVMPGASGVLHSRQEGVHTLAYAVPRPVAEVRAFYAQALGGSGFQEKEPGVWRKGTEELVLKLQQAEGGQTAVVIIRRAVAPEAPPGVVD